MKNLRWQLLIVAIALVAIAVLLFTQRQTIDGPGVQPAAGGSYTEGLVGRLGRLNPLLDNYNQVDKDINRLIFSSLIRFDSRGAPTADLAEAWGVSVNGLVYNVTLRQDAVWHDGEDVTSEDVLFTIELLRSPEMPATEDLRAFWEAIEVEAFDEYNLQFRLPEPFAPFLDYLSFGILPQHIFAEEIPADIINSESNLAPIGSGPYQFGQLLGENNQIEGIVLQANSQYYGQQPLIGQIAFRFYADQSSAMDAYQQGEIDGIGQVDGDVLGAALADPNLNVYSSRLPLLTMILFNLDSPEVAFFQDPLLRTALLTGLNRDKMIGTVLDGQGVVADGPIMPGTWSYYEDQPRIAFNANDALRSLKAQGYSIPAEGGSTRGRDGVMLSFQLVHPDDPVHTALAEMIKEEWAFLGVTVDLVAVDAVTLHEDYLNPRTYQAALVDLDFTGLPDPDPYPFWHQSQATGGQNYSRWNDRRASEYLERARVATLVETRMRLYRNFQIHFSREMPALPLFYMVYNYAVDAQVQGISIGPLFDPSDRFAGVFEWALVLRTPIEELPTETSIP
ncbi:MAG: peptide ABC transporter substrate-binding protein [Anaerolineae bacterium]|nr:peptide ABC transporter substrate-binding protein [Anaerolineae bacterium]